MTARLVTAGAWNATVGWRAFALGIAGLATAVMLRAALLRQPIRSDGLDGVVFAAVLVATAAGTNALAATNPRNAATELAARLRDPQTSLARAVTLGLLGGGVLIAVPLGMHAFGPLAGSFEPSRGIGIGLGVWVAVTMLVALAEEWLLRGALFDAARAVAGIPGTLLLTSAAFALMHVPFYGWGVVPVDFAVGLWLGGLRLATGRVSAPAAAHVLADLATWWL